MQVGIYKRQDIRRLCRGGSGGENACCEQGFDR
jgi:hypothetical protein